MWPMGWAEPITAQSSPLGAL
ncbi:unnamed protein product, partial [Adineta steineri]